MIFNCQGGVDKWDEEAETAQLVPNYLHYVIMSSCHHVIIVIMFSYYQSFIFNVATDKPMNNIRTYRSASHNFANITYHISCSYSQKSVLHASPCPAECMQDVGVCREYKWWHCRLTAPVCGWWMVRLSPAHLSHLILSNIWPGPADEYALDFLNSNIYSSE